jgi:hypothetical protein
VRIRNLTVVLLCCLLIGLAAPVFAVSGGDVVIGNELVLRIRSASAGLSIEERRDIVTQRINDLLGSDPFNPSDLKVTTVNKATVIMVGDKMIVTVDKETAAINKTTPQKLAEAWAANLRRVIPKAKAGVK